MRPFPTPWGLQEGKCVYWKVSVGLKCVRMSRIPWLWNIDSRLKEAFVFCRPPEVLNFRQKSLLETTFSQSKQICSFDDGDKHTRSIDLVGVESTHSAIENETGNPKCESRHSPFLARNANGNPSSETSRPLATSSLAVARFAAKQGSLRSPTGRLVASLLLPQCCSSLKELEKFL